MEGYRVIGRLSEINLNDIVEPNGDRYWVNGKELRRVLTYSLTIFAAIVLDEVLFSGLILAADGVQSTAQSYSPPVELKSFVNFVHWLIWLLRWIVSSVIGLIVTYAGYRWATDISGDGQGAAKKIIRNCVAGAIMTWTGTTIANVFIDTLNKYLV